MKKLYLFSGLLTLIVLTHSGSIFTMEQRAEKNQEASTSECQSTCSLCFTDAPNHEFRQLGCGHKFCAECLQELLILALDKEWAHSMAKYLQCPQKGCCYQMNEKDILTITNDASRVARYHEALNIVHKNAHRIRCRAKRTAQCDQTEQKATHNNNNNNPSDAHTNPNDTQEEQSEEWIRQNTKACPECGVNVQKDGGCVHMVCRSCNHEFCWECLSQWKMGTKKHYGFYSCPKKASTQTMH